MESHTLGFQISTNEIVADVGKAREGLGMRSRVVAMSTSKGQEIAASPASQSSGKFRPSTATELPERLCADRSNALAFLRFRTIFITVLNSLLVS